MEGKWSETGKGSGVKQGVNNPGKEEEGRGRREKGQ